MVCHRCQQPGHWWGNCTAPFDKIWCSPKQIHWPERQKGGGGKLGKSGTPPQGGEGGREESRVGYPEEEIVNDKHVMEGADATEELSNPPTDMAPEAD